MDPEDQRDFRARLRASRDDWFREIRRIVDEAPDSRAVEKAAYRCYLCRAQVGIEARSPADERLFLCPACRDRERERASA